MHWGNGVHWSPLHWILRSPRVDPFWIHPGHRGMKVNGLEHHSSNCYGLRWSPLDLRGAIFHPWDKKGPRSAEISSGQSLGEWGHLCEGPTMTYPWSYRAWTRPVQGLSRTCDHFEALKDCPNALNGPITWPYWASISLIPWVCNTLHPAIRASGNDSL